MNVGTKSLLFGVHQFLWHPFTVWLAWVRLYRTLPNWWQCIAIFCHDLGYWGAPNMDGPEGRAHPRKGADIAGKIAGDIWDFFHPFCTERDSHEFYLKVIHFTLYHSRELSKTFNEVPSPLCWADKYCVMIEPRWFYLLRARLSGELDEYISNASPIKDILEIKTAAQSRESAEWYWLDWYRCKICNLTAIKKLLTK